MTSKIFKLSDSITVQSIGVALEQFFMEKKDMIAEGRVTPQGYFVQAKKKETWKKFVGMDNAIQVQIFDMNNGTINVQLGEAKWAEKILTAGAGAVVFAPLLATTAFGAWQQKNLPDEIFEFVESYIISGGKSVTVSMTSSIVATENQVACSSCNARNSVNSKFCMSCGNKLFDDCPGCNARLSKGTKFCSECGTNVNQAKQKICSGCNQEVESTAKFCNNCGTAQ